MEKNSLWKNIRNKAAQNKKTGATPKKPTKEMLAQERNIKANSKMFGGDVNIKNKIGSGVGGGLVAGAGLALLASKLFGKNDNDILPDVGKMKYGGKMKNC